MFSNYAKMDDPVINRNMERFNEPSGMDLPIDDYFSKQEECQEIAEDTNVKITDKIMVQKLTTHMGKTGPIRSDNYKFKQNNNQQTRRGRKPRSGTETPSRSSNQSTRRRASKRPSSQTTLR